MIIIKTSTTRSNGNNLELLKSFSIALVFFVTLSSYSQNNVSDKIEAYNKKLILIELERDSIINIIEELKLENIRYELNEFGLPELKEDEELIMHSAMALVYDDSHKTARWVAHIITYDIVVGNVVRSNDFRPDPKVKHGTAVEEDYFLKEKQPDESYRYDGFGYDRGHLAPSADFRWSEKALSESYYYSNITPQTADFNRISWASLENIFRSYVQSNEGSQLYIITAPVLHDELPRIERGVNNVSIPEYHYKIAVDLDNEKGIAFLMPNKLASKSLENYAVTIDSIEAITGINFFHKLPEELQDKIESQNDPFYWFGAEEKDDKLPIPMNVLPRNHFNTTQAKRLIDSNRRVSVCGTVVSGRKSGRGNIFLNLDKSFPNHIFSVTVFSDNVVNFSYEPHIVLMNEQICVTGRVTDFNGIPSMVIDNEKAINLFEYE